MFAWGAAQTTAGVKRSQLGAVMPSFTQVTLGRAILRLESTGRARGAAQLSSLVTISPLHTGNSMGQPNSATFGARITLHTLEHSWESLVEPPPTQSTCRQIGTCRHARLAVSARRTRHTILHCLLVSVLPRRARLALNAILGVIASFTRCALPRNGHSMSSRRTRSGT